jgi:hypothetical protein
MDMEISLANVNVMDEITIRTQANDYYFRVIDPVFCRGLLSGGLLGNRNHEAFLAGCLPVGRNVTTDATRLVTGARAVFLLSRDGVDKLTTSIVTGLKINSEHADESAAADC